MRNKKLWGAAILVVLILAGFVGFKQANRKKAEPGFKAIKVERGNIQVTILATGVVQPQNRVEIKPPIAGRAEEIMVKEGQTVKKGRVLAWMSSVERAALLDAARAKGPEELSHWEDLYKPTPLVAPLDGLIISRNIEPGQTVTAQDAVIVMSNRLIVKAQVDETDIGQVRVGQKAEITLDAYSQIKIPAQVSHIAYEAKTVNNVTIYEVDIVPAKVMGFMRSGMTANVTFFTAEKNNVLILPADAVRQENGNVPTVLAPDTSEKNRPKTKTIEVGLSDGKHVEIVAGLEEGDVVLTKSLQIPSGSKNQQGSPFAPWGRPQRERGQRNRSQ